MGSGTDKKIVLFISMLGAFLIPFMSSSIVIALPSIGKEFNTSSVLSNWIITSFLLAAAIFVVPFGRIADIYGRKKVFLYGVIIFTAGSIICGAAISIEILIIARVLQGIGGAMVYGTSMAILTSVYPSGERGRALGLNVAVTYLGLSLGPVLGGVMTDILGWRSIFFVNVPLGILIIYFILAKLEAEWAEAKGEKFDFIGSVIYGIGLFCIMTGLSMVNGSMTGPLVMLAGIISIVGFGIFELKNKNPVLNLTLFKSNKVFVFSSLAALINYSATYAVSYLLSLYLQYIKGFGPQHAGLFLLIQPAIQAVFSPVTGKLSDKIEPQKVASLGMAMCTGGLIFLIILSFSYSFLLVIAALIMLGFGFALFSSPNTNAIMSSVEKKHYGVTSGILGTARLVGQTFSMGIASLVFAVFIGRAKLSQNYHPNFIISFRTVFIVVTVLSFVGIFASLARGKLRE